MEVPLPLDSIKEDDDSSEEEDPDEDELRVFGSMCVNRRRSRGFSRTRDGLTGKSPNGF